MLHPSPRAWLSQYYLGYFFSYGAYIPFWALWLKGIGISASDIGMLLGLGFAIRCVSNLLFPPMINKMTQLLPAMRLITLCTTVLFTGYFLATESFFALVVVTVVFNLAVGPAVPVSDTLGNYYAKIKQLDYGRTRLWGSLAFMVGSFVTGFVADHLGFTSIPYVMLIGLVCTVLLVLRQPTVKPQDEVSTMGGAKKVKLLPLLKNKNVLMLLVVTSLIQGSHAGYYNFSSLYWADVGYSESMISFFWGLGIVGEVFVFAIAKKVFAGWNNNQMIRLAAIGVLLRWSVLASTTNPAFISCVQLLHGVTFACAHLATLNYIQSVASKYMVSLQSLYNAISMSAFIAFMSVICGLVYSIEPSFVFWLMACMGIPALFIKLDKLELD